MGYDIPADHHGSLPATDSSGETRRVVFTSPADNALGYPAPPTKNLNDYAKEVHVANAKWWSDIHTGAPIDRNVGELLMLVTSELAEALEGHRKNLMDDHLPTRKMFEVEIADAVIRLLDIAAGLGLDLEGAYQEKMAYNKVRADHQIENRLKADGKKY